MTSHFGLMLVFAFFVSLIVFATIDEGHAQRAGAARREDVRDVHRRGDRARLGPAPLPVVIGLWLPVAVFMAAIYYGAALPQCPGPADWFSDTVLHAGGYAVLGAADAARNGQGPMVRRHARRDDRVAL